MICEKICIEEDFDGNIHNLVKQYSSIFYIFNPLVFVLLVYHLLYFNMELVVLILNFDDDV